MSWFKSKKATRPINKTEKVAIYLCSTELISNILKRLVDSTDWESECFVSGISYGRTLIPMTIFKPKHITRTVVSARADPLSLYDLYLYNRKFGLTIYLMCHLHPGNGPHSTYPSPIDMATMKRWEHNYPLVGLIFTRSGYFRFFSVKREFKVRIKGKGIERYDEKLYRIKN